MQKCGFCSLFSGFMRRTMCVGSRRGSSDSYYRELGDQDTLKIEDKSSGLSEDSEETNQQPTQKIDRNAEFVNMTKKNLCTGRFLTIHKRRKKCLMTRSLYQDPGLLDDTQPGQVQVLLFKMSDKLADLFKSNKGGLKLFYQGYSYEKNKLFKNRFYWNCEFRKHEIYKCKASAVSTENEVNNQVHNVEHLKYEHNHEPDPLRKEISDFKEKLKQDAKTGLKVCQILQNNQSSCSKAVLDNLPSKPALKQIIYRAKSKVPSKIEPKDIFFEIDENEAKLNNEKFIIKDKTYDTNKRIILLSNKNLMKLLEAADYWVLDGTFKIVPTIFQQLYTIHGNIAITGNKTKTFPLLYCLCTNKNRKTYDVMFELLNEYGTENDMTFSPKICILDFEKASIQSLKNIYENVILYGCHFHLGQILYRQIQTRGLTQKYATDITFRDEVKCILALSFLSANEIPYYFHKLLEELQGRCLPVLCDHLFHAYGLISHFNLDATKVWKLASLIEEGYHSSNPYHNAVHAADVTQAMHCFLQQNQIRDYLEPLEIMASLLAAVAHDIDHPGVNQSFLIATSNHLAALYENTSVLENHHWRSAVSCIIQSGLFEHDDELRSKLEKKICSLILATDITRQQEYLSQFKNYLDTDTLDMSNSEHRQLVLQIALKCADISNPCRHWEISRKWSLKVCEEFFRQGDYERRLNLPITPLCDRHTTSIPKIQTGFFKFVVTPLITEWDRFLNNDLSSQMLKNLKYNQNKWEMSMIQEMTEEAKTKISDTELIDDDLETCSGTNVSDSSELLLPLRRGSLNHTKPQSGLREQLRRFSVPLNVFQDSKLIIREKKRSSSLSNSQSDADIDSLLGSDMTLHSQQSVCGNYHHAHEDTEEKILSTENLLPDSSITSITTPVQATRLNRVIKEGGWKLVRQQTFPPLDPHSHIHALLARPLFTSNEDLLYPSRQTKTDDTQNPTVSNVEEHRFRNLFSRNDTDKTDNDDALESSSLVNEVVEVAEEAQRLEKENSIWKTLSATRTESLSVGSQLRDNLTSVQLSTLDPGQLLHRRKSMPTDTTSISSIERRMREMAAILPQFLRRTLSGRECWPRRRGSAPAPVAVSELRGLATLGNFRHSINGGRRKQTAVVQPCQHWFTKTTFAVQDQVVYQPPRRSSLPAEVITGNSRY